MYIYSSGPNREYWVSSGGWVESSTLTNASDDAAGTATAAVLNMIYNKFRKEGSVRSFMNVEKLISAWNVRHGGIS